MTFTLADFCAAARDALRAGPLDAALTTIVEKLSVLLKQPNFVAETFAADAAPGKRELFHDPECDFHVMAHVQSPGQKGQPHDHGASWAVYGTAMGVTRMTDWRRANEDPDHVALEQVRAYDLMPGQAHYFGPHALHSTEHAEKTWVIRVTGTNLDTIPRYHFRARTDRILERA